MAWSLLISAFTIFGMMAARALAECPTSGDLPQGLVLTRNNPFLSSLFKQTPNGLSEFRIVKKGAAAEDVTATYLHALAPSDRVSAKNTVTVEYDEPVAFLDDMPEQKVWHSAVSVYVDGYLAMEGTAAKTFVGEEEIAVGECRYSTWVVEDRLVIGPDGGTYFLQYYAPKLGLVISSIKMDSDGKPLSGVQFDMITVGQN